MDKVAFLEACRAEFSARTGAARAAFRPEGLIGDERLTGIARASIGAVLDAMGDAGTIALLSRMPEILDAAVADPAPHDLREALRGCAVEVAARHLEPDVSRALAHGQDAATLGRAVEAAANAMRSCIAGGRSAIHDHEEILARLADTREWDTPLYGSLANLVAAHLRSGGEYACAEALVAAHAARGHVLLETRTHGESGR
jgi:hypothetical protein